MMQTIQATDDRLNWTGAISLQNTDGAITPWRIPHEQKDLFAWPLVEKAAMPAGVTLEFQTDSETLELMTDPFPNRSPVDLFSDGQFHSSVTSSEKDRIGFRNLGSHTKEIKIWLPQHGEFIFKGLNISGSAVISKASSKNFPEWTTYGSSITQCRDAKSPSVTWPSIVARSNDLALTCLGYGGNCHLDPMIARMIRDSKADLISLCLGINIYAYSSLNQRTFQPGIFAFIEILREKHKTVSVIVMSPIYAAKDNAETTPNEVGFTLQGMRREIKEAVEILNYLGDKNVFYLDGLSIFDQAQAHLLHDGIHPNSEGYRAIAENISQSLHPYISNLR